jgi:hypothetical protein
MDINDAYNTTNIGMIQLLNSSVVTDPANAAQVQAVATAKLTAVAMKNATKLTWNSNNATMLATNTYTSIFQTGTWAVGNASLAGVLPNNAQVFMPYMPQEDDVGFD